MKRLLRSLLFAILFLLLYSGLYLLIVLIVMFLKITDPSSYIYVALGLLSLPITWTAIIFEGVVRSNANLARGIQFTPALILWMISANIMLYWVIFYLILLLFPYLKKSKQNVE